MHRMLSGVFCLLIGSSVGSALADEALENLLKKLPPSTNSIVIINAKAVFNSPIAKAQDWATKSEARFSSGAHNIPPMVDLAVLGAQIDDESRKAKQEVGLVLLNKPVDMASIALRERGKVETIVDVQTVESARNGYFGKMDDNLVGFMFPSNRREYAKWLRIIKHSDRIPLSNYLKEAAAVAAEAPIVIALDAEDATDEIRVMHALKGCSLDSMSANEMEECARSLASVRGITFAVQVQDAIFGKVRVDLQRSAGPLAKHAKELFIELLSNNGLLIDDFKTWSGKAEGSSATFSGPMSATGLRQLLAIVSEMPSGAFDNDDSFGKKPQPSDSAAQLNPKLAASQKYYKTTLSLLDELRKYSPQTTGQYATMHERYALKIDRMPIYNVDDELLGWGASTSNHLRAVAMSLRGANIEKGIIDTSRPTTSGYIGYGGWGLGSGGTVDSSAYWAAKKQATAKGTQSRLDQWSQIDQESSEIRRAMVAKYMADF